MIEVRGLSKEYADVVAVEDSTFSVEPGEVFGVVGPNGAGKTTTLKTLVGLLEPTEGEVRVAGGDPAETETRLSIGYLPEESPLYEDMTALSYLHFFADLYDVPREVADERIHNTLDRLELERRGARAGNMSKGMKRKVAVARSLINDPDVLVYDEPASGLDPLTTNYVVEFVRDLADEGKAVVFSAHNLYHVERVCDRVIIMNQGDVSARGTLDEIRTEYGDIEYRVNSTVAVDGSEPTDGKSEVYSVTVESMEGLDRVREQVGDKGGEVLDIRTHEPSLEDIFLDVAQKEGNG